MDLGDRSFRAVPLAVESGVAASVASRRLSVRGIRGRSCESVCQTNNCLLRFSLSRPAKRSACPAPFVSQLIGCNFSTLFASSGLPSDSSADPASPDLTDVSLFFLGGGERRAINRVRANFAKALSFAHPTLTSFAQQSSRLTRPRSLIPAMSVDHDGPLSVSPP